MEAKTFAQNAILKLAEERSCGLQDCKYQHHRDYSVHNEHDFLEQLPIRNMRGAAHSETDHEDYDAQRF